MVFKKEPKSIKKILFTAPVFHPNQYFASKELSNMGIEIYYLIFRKHTLAKQDHINVLLAKQATFSKLFDIIFRILKFNSLAENPSSPFKFPSIFYTFGILKKIKPDIVVIRGRSFYSVVVGIVCKLLNINALRYEQVVLETDETVINKIIPRNIFNLIKKIQNIFLPRVLVTPIIKNPNMSFKYMVKKKRYFLPLPIPTGNKRIYDDGKTIKLLMVAKFQVIKNHILFLESVLKIRMKYNFEITFVGRIGDKSHLKKIKKYIRDHKIEKVTFKYNLSHQEVLKEYPKHDIFILPTTGEEFGYAPIEALAHGLPLLISSDTGNKYLISSKKRNGYVFEIDGPHDLAEKLDMLATNKEKLKIYGNNAYEFVKKYYSPDKYKDNFKKIIKEEFNMVLD